MMFPRLDISKVELLVFSDASHANLQDKVSSCFGYIIFLSDGRNCCPIMWKSAKIQRVVRSTLAAEALALGEAGDAAMFISKFLSDVSLKYVPKIRCFSDNKSKINIMSTKSVAERRLRIDIAILKEMLEKTEIESIIWVPTNLRLAYVLTKRGKSPYNLSEVLESGTISFLKQKGKF